MIVNVYFKKAVECVNKVIFDLYLSVFPMPSWHASSLSRSFSSSHLSILIPCSLLQKLRHAPFPISVPSYRCSDVVLISFYRPFYPVGFLYCHQSHCSSRHHGDWNSSNFRRKSGQLLKFLRGNKHRHPSDRQSHHGRTTPQCIGIKINWTYK